MNNIRISTIIVIICIFIIGLYAMGEVNYFASKIVAEGNIDAPTVLIPSVGIQEKINEESLSQGVLHDPDSYNPTEGDVILFGHRTLQGSPFLRLNDVKVGDSIVLEWPGIGEETYTVKDSVVVPASSNLDASEGGNTLYLVTCDPIGSSANRLIIQAELSNTGPLNNQIVSENPQASYAFYIATAFLVLGLVFSLIYPKDNRIYIFIAVLVMSAILFYFCINPIPSDVIYSKISFLNGEGIWM